MALAIKVEDEEDLDVAEVAMDVAEEAMDVAEEAVGEKAEGVVEIADEEVAVAGMTAEVAAVETGVEEGLAVIVRDLTDHSAITLVPPQTRMALGNDREKTSRKASVLKGKPATHQDPHVRPVSTQRESHSKALCLC